MDLRADGFVERFRPPLAEAERGDVVQGAAGGPAIAEVGAAHGVEADATVLDGRVAAVGKAAVLYAVEHEVEVGAGPRLGAKVDVVGESPGGEILNAVGDVGAAIDGPEVSQAEHFAALRAVAEVGHEEAALARLGSQRVVKEKRVKDGEVPQNVRAVVGDGAVVGDDIEAAALQPPPRVGQFAVGGPAVIEDVLFADALRPLPFEMEGRTAGEDSRAGDDFRLCLADDVVELAALGVGVVLDAAGPQLHVPIEIPEEDVAFGAHIPGFLVPFDLVGAEEQAGIFELGGVSVQRVDAAFQFLAFGDDVPLSQRNGLGGDRGGRDFAGGLLGQGSGG